MNESRHSDRVPVLGNKENAKEVVNDKYLHSDRLLIKKIIESVPDFQLTMGSVFIDETIKVNSLITFKNQSNVISLSVNK